MSSRASEVVSALEAAFGPQHWWPAETPFEVCVGAILTQNTAWGNVERAIANLKAAGAMTPAAVADVPLKRLEELITPAGTFRIKAKRLHRFCRWLIDEYGGDLDRLFDRSAESLRETLLEIPGIGPETADSITLYAGRKPTMPGSAYAHRILARHGWIDWESRYDEVRDWFMDGLPREEQLFNQAHALLVRTGKDHCRTKPRCEECPLRPMLPASGPVERPRC